MQMHVGKLSTKPNWRETHDRALMCALNLKTAYRELLAVLIEVERHHIYQQLEATSLYSYCVDILSLPSHTAYDFIDVIRTSKKVPQLAEAIFQGKTTISKARRVCSVITPKNQKEWIELASENPFRVVQKAVSEASPRGTTAAPKKIEIRLNVDPSWAEMLREVKTRMSEKARRTLFTEEVIFQLMTDYMGKGSNPMNQAIPQQKFRPASRPA